MSPYRTPFGSRNKGGAGVQVAHGLGLIGAAFGLAIGVGPVIGGALSQLHRRAACFLCVTLSALALTSLRVYGWAETAPGKVSQESVLAADDRHNQCSWVWHAVNPLYVLKVFVNSRCGTHARAMSLAGGMHYYHST